MVILLLVVLMVLIAIFQLIILILARLSSSCELVFIFLYYSAKCTSCRVRQVLHTLRTYAPP